MAQTNDGTPDREAVSYAKASSSELDDLLAEYGANRAQAYVDYGDSVEYTVIAENLKKEAKERLTRFITKQCNEAVVSERAWAYRQLRNGNPTIATVELAKERLERAELKRLEGKTR